MNAAQYAAQLRSARRAYEDSSDHSAYMADCLYIALSIAAKSLAERDARLSHLSTALGVAQYGVKGLVDMVAHNLSCPIGEQHDHEDFLISWYNHGRHFVDRDTKVVRDILTHMGVWRESK